MKKLTRLLLTMAVTAALLCGGALAAEDGSLTVQLDGQTMTFTDAQPQMKDSRTFLPVRALFEAMGAEVSYDAETCVVTAVRGDRTVTMTLGSNEVTVAQGEDSSTFTMDVEPYVDVETWRTYVPVRFAAQALDCAVGWEQESYTVVIVDTEKLADNALAGKTYTWIEKLAAYSEKYNKGIWKANMDVKGAMTLLGANMPMAVTVNGTVADQTKMDMSMNMTMDMRQLMLLLQQMGGGVEMTEQEQALLDAMATGGFDMAMRGDLDAGTFAMNLSGEALEAVLTEEQKAQMKGASLKDVWFSMNMEAMMAQSGLGMDWTQYMALVKAQAGQVELADLVKEILTGLEADVNDAKTGYTGLKAEVERVAAALSDQGLVKEGDVCTIALDMNQEAIKAQLKILLTMKEDKVTAYTMEMTVSSAASEDGSTPAMNMAMTLGVDEQDKIAGQITLDMSPMATMLFDITGGYQKGTELPKTEPPAGAVILDMSDPEAINAAMGVMPLPAQA